MPPLSGFFIKSDGACRRHPARLSADWRHSCAPRYSQLRVLARFQRSALPVPVIPGSFESGRPSPRNHKTCLCPIENSEEPKMR